MAEAAAVRRRRPVLSWRLLLSGAWLGLVVFAAIFAPLIAPHDPLGQDLLLGRVPPIWMAGSEPGYLLGTDGLGRDVLSRLIYGSRIALSVAFIAAPGACIIGSILGLLAGYYRGFTDQIVSRVVDIWMSFPPVLFCILLVAVLGTGLSSVIIAIVLIDWIRFSRVVRAETLNQSRMDYVDSARAAGFSRLAILVKEVLPNVLPAIAVLLTLQMAIAVIVEAILSFVSLSISTDDPTWGGMIAEGRTIIYSAWWVLVFPLIVLFLTVLAFGQFGEGLKDRFDPVLQ
jgi:peptide/nickel transport system permease protein